MSSSNERIYALVPCAGTGVRARSAGPKQYVTVAGRPLVGHTLAALELVSEVTATMVVLAPQDRDFEEQLPGFQGPRGWVERCGGATRAASVLAGLQALRGRGAAEDDWVLVHDAARCLLRPEWVQALIKACRRDDVGGLLALPLADTLKVQGEPPPGQDPLRVASTLSRAGKWIAQTPQMFRVGLLQRALQAARAEGEEVTDEASAVERLGLAPLLVEGHLENFKVTFPADFQLAHRLLHAA